MLKVSFVGEAAIDDGGPRREYFQLLLRDIASKSGLFKGYPDHVVPVHSIEALAGNKFFTVGKMLATALVQGGEPPAYFAGAVADYLVFDQVRSTVDLDDISDYEVRQCLHEVEKTTTSEELQALVDDPSYNFRYACGYCKPIQQINKKEFLNAVWLHYVFFQPHAELVQLKSGFWETLQVELLACMHGKEIRAYLACSPAFNVSVKCLQEMFAIRYSDNGTNDRTKEEAVIISTGWITSRIANMAGV